MKIDIKTKNLELTDEIDSYAREKIGRLAHFDKNIMETVVRLFSGKEHTSETKFRAEVTMHLPQTMLVAEAKAQEIYAAIDIVSEKLERQVEKYKDKIIDKR